MDQIREIKTVSPRQHSRSFFARLSGFFRGNAVLLLAFFIPFLLITAAFALEGVWPFPHPVDSPFEWKIGENQILNYDAWHQYYPFWMQLHDHLREGTGLLYDPDMGLGTNFLSLLSYYGASPLNLLTVFFAERDQRILFTLLTSVRIGAAGLFCAVFLRKFNKKKENGVVFFSTLYALCGYIAGYYWNVMWLDSVALLPLLALGMAALFREGKFRLYVVTLALTLFCNYYVGYMCCIFMVLSFFALWMIDHPPFSVVWRKALRFAAFSLLGGALAAVLLLPAYFGLQNTYSVSSGGPTGITIYQSFLDLFAGFADLHEPTALDGLPNVYVGAVVALFAFLFFLSRRIGPWEKAACYFLLGFFVLSLNVNVLDWAWHGFHFTNQIPFRFSFLLAFVMVTMAYRYFLTGAGRVDWVDLVGGFLFTGFLAFCAYRIYSNASFAVTAVVLSATLVMITLYAKEFVNRRVFAAVIGVILTAEAGASAFLGVRAVGTTDYAGYYDGETGEKIAQAVDYVREIEGDSFYRMEVTEARSLNDSCLYRYPGVTQFSSSANVHVSTFCEALGLAADDGSNRFAYVHGTSLNNTLLGIKYLISKSAKLNDTDLKELRTDTASAFTLYRYEGFIGQGFMMPEEAADFELKRGSDPVEVQNAVFRAATGLEQDYLQVIDVTNVGHRNLSVTRRAQGDYDFTVEDAKEDVTYLKYNYTMPKNGMVYIFADVPEANYIQVNNAWHNISEYPSFFSAGYFRAGEIFSLRANIDETVYEGGEAHLFVCVLRDDVWQKGLEAMRDEPLTWSVRENTRLEGEITALKDGYLYTSIPYESSGWRVWVDGEEAEVLPFANAFVGVKLSAGTHSIRMTYSPQGFTAGRILSLVSLAALIAIAVLTRKKEFRVFWSEKEIPAPAGLPASPEPAEPEEPAEPVAPAEPAEPEEPAAPEEEKEAPRDA